MNSFSQIKFSTFGKADCLTRFMREDKAEELFDKLFDSPKCYKAEMRTWELNEDTGCYDESVFVKKFNYGVLNVHGELFKVSIY